MLDYEPKRVSVRELFKHDNSFVIPRYQRSYAWRPDNIDDFYEDFVRTTKENMNFFGTFVFDVSNEAAYEVIDGQQRLMTLTIFYAMLRDLLNEDIANPTAYKLAENINSAYVRSDDDLSLDETVLFKIKASKDAEDFFLQYIQMGGQDRRKSAKIKNQAEKQIKSAYERLRKTFVEDKLSNEKLTTEQKIQLIKDSARKVSLVTAIKIEIYNNDIAYAIFESHNAKGADLLISDLIKNYYYSCLTGPHDKREAVMDDWDKNVERLRNQASVKIDNFLHYYVQSYDGRFLKSQLYKRIKNEIKDDTDSFTKRFKEQSDLFVNLKDASISSIPDSARLNLSLERIANFNVDQVYIFLLSLIRNRDKLNISHLKKIVETIEKHIFIYNIISKKQANVLEKIYGMYSSKLEKELQTLAGDKLLASSGSFCSTFTNALKQTMPKLEEFSAAFVDLNYSSPKEKRLMKDYIFPVIEEKLSNSGMTFGVNISLEHISPQNGPIRLIQTHKIGNLVPIDASSNSKLGNKDLISKLPIYKEFSNKNINLLLAFVEANGTNFDDESINLRGSELAKLAYEKVWHID